jgi:hypothetical protein
MTSEPTTEPGRVAKHIFGQDVEYAQHPDPMTGEDWDRLAALISVAEKAKVARLRELVGELAHEYHAYGLIKDHADPTDKTGWNVRGIETCGDVLCRQALAETAEPPA